LVVDKVYVGFDPGLGGGVGAIHPDGRCLTLDFPTITYATGKKTRKGNAKKKQDYSGSAMRHLLDPVVEFARGCPIFGVIEHVQAQRKDTPVTAFSLGRSRGVLECLLWCNGIPYELVTPASWKPKMVGTGSDKEASRLKAQQLFPAADLSLKKHHGRAEALLIAEFFRRKQLGIDMPSYRKVKKVKKVKKKAIRKKLRPK
jgi:Holliday junction resolvasome RuvABC endonuclease subunit